MKAVITGGAGFIGTHLANQLISQGYEVFILDNLSPQIHGRNPSYQLPPQCTLIRIGIEEACNSVDIFESADVVYHLAAETGTGQSMYEMTRYTNANCAGTASMLEAFSNCKNKPKRVVLASSRSVYGEGAYAHVDGSGSIVQVEARAKESMESADWEHKSKGGVILKPVATPEDFPFKPASFYAATKASQELMLMSCSHALGFKLTIFRFQNVYGPGQSLSNPYTGIISIFYNKIRQGLPIPIYEDGLESRDFIYIQDVVDGLLLPLKSNRHFSIYNLGSGIATSVFDLANLMVEVSGHKSDIQITGQYRLGDIRHCFADMSRIQSDYNFQPIVELREGLRWFCDWASNQPTWEDLSGLASLELHSRGLGS